MIRNLCLVPLLMLLFSCQTTKIIETTLPINLDRMFGVCMAGDGSVLLKVEQDGALLFVSEADWVAKEKEWTIQAYNSFGQTMGTLQANLVSKTLNLDTKLLAEVKLGMESNDNLTYKDYFVGLKADELPCILKQKFPSNWKQKLTAVEMKGKQAKLELSDAGRDISIVIDNINSVSPSFCTNFAWSEYFGIVKNSFEFCYLESKDISKMTFSNGVSVEWSKIQTI